MQPSAKPAILAPKPAVSLTSPSEPGAVETAIRQLIGNGKSKAALDRAKDYHKAIATAASETLLLDAYVARIHSLLQVNLTLEAKSLVDLLKQRYPAVRDRLDNISVSIAARSGTLDDLLRPLTEPALSAGRRAGIEQAIMCEIADLGALARCEALPADHSLRTAAAALEKAFTSATKGPVSADDLALPEVSHRSPLAPWKLLVKAIGCFYRREDESCRALLSAIHPESVPARLVPVFRTLLGESAAPHFSPCAQYLVSEVLSNLAAARASLVALDKAFSSEYEEDILPQIRATLKVCEREVPHFVARLRQHISAQGLFEDLDSEDMSAALGKPVLPDAYMMRLVARTTETMTSEPSKITVACSAWHQFLQKAVSEKWFEEESLESAAVYLHIAAQLSRIPAKHLKKIQKNNPAKGASGENLIFIYPEKLYKRAMEIDPHTEGFAAWRSWAETQSPQAAEIAAKEWRKALPSDLPPVLKLLESADKRGSYKAALDYLAEAEEIDGLNPAVRKARVKLLTAAILRHLQQAKPHLAEAKIAELGEVSSMRQGDGPAYLAAMRYMVNYVRGGNRRAEELSEMEQVLGSPLAARLLLVSLSRATGIEVPDELPRVKNLDSRGGADLVPALGKVAVLCSASGLNQMFYPLEYMAEATKRIAGGERSLDAAQLRRLGHLGLQGGHFELAYAVSSAGLDLGPGMEAAFLMIRAGSLPQEQKMWQRQLVLAAAAAELGRKHRDMEVVDDAVEFLHNEDHDDFPLPPEKLASVLEKERRASKFPSGAAFNPDYGDLFERQCDCPACRAGRGEPAGDSYDDDEFDDEIEVKALEKQFMDLLPREIPKDMAKMLIEEAKRALINGEPPGAMLDRVFGPPPKKKRKGWTPW